MNLNKAGDWFIIPITIIQFALKEKKVRELQQLIALKSISSGVLFWNLETKKILADKMKVSIRTIESTQSKLISLDWIGKNNGRVYLRNFELISTRMGLKLRTGVQFHPDDLRYFKAYLIGAFLGYLVNMQKLKYRKGALGKSGLQIMRSNKSTEIPKALPVSCIALSKILCCSISQAYHYKKMANDRKYIKLKSDIRVIENVALDQINQFRKSVPEIARKIIIKGKKVVEQRPDLIEPNMKYKARRKSNHNNGGYRGKSYFKYER